MEAIPQTAILQQKFVGLDNEIKMLWSEIKQLHAVIDKIIERIDKLEQFKAKKG